MALKGNRNDRETAEMKPVQARKGTQAQKKASGDVKTLSRITAVACMVTVIALGIGLYLAFTGMAQMRTYQEETTRVLVANGELPEGHEVGQGDVTYKDIANSAVPNGALKDTGDAVGKQVTGYFSKGAILTASGLTGDNAATAAGRVSTGKVAISLGVSQQTGVSGLIYQGDEVSVLGTSNTQGEAVAEVLAEHAKVIALDAKIDGYNSEYTAVTLEVDPANAQKIAAAQAYGQVTVVLESKTGE